MRTRIGTSSKRVVRQGLRIISVLALALVHACGGDKGSQGGNPAEIASTKNAACTALNYCWNVVEVTPGNCVSFPAYSSCAFTQGFSVALRLIQSGRFARSTQGVSEAGQRNAATAG